MKRIYLALLCLGFMTGCRYNMLPPIPAEQIHIQLPVRLSQVSLVREDDELVLRAFLETKTAGYLAVHWFRDTQEIGTDSIYLDPQDPRGEWRFPAKEKGAYRVGIVFDGQLLRQLELYEIDPS